jgi:hypothetical protein
MKILLPIIIATVLFFSNSQAVFAQVQTPVPAATPGSASTLGTTPSATCKVEDWECNSEVTFVGKLARRSLDTLDRIIANYQWFAVSDTDKAKGDPLQVLWVFIRNVVYAIIGLFILAAAFIIIYTRGENITVRRFIPRFIGIIILVTLSYSIIQFIYIITDVIQGFFLRLPNGNFISSQNLLSVSFNYQEFIGLRRIGEKYDEAATISLILTKLTAASYFVMSAILIIRKVILWFFILVSPIFPLLIFFNPLRNTAKIWVGEFFRWTLYAPLFAVFLRGIVEIWQRYIPQGFDFQAQGAKAGTDVVYPTAINILLGGPSQPVSITNSLNLPDTFIQYAVALIMIWMVIIMPFILLRIFLSYFYGMSLSDNSLVKYLARGVPPKTPPPPKSPSYTPSFKHPPMPPIVPPSGSTGLARSIFEEVQKSISEPVNQQTQISQSNMQNNMQNAMQNMTQQSQAGVRETTNIASSMANVSSGQLIFSAPIQSTPELQNAITEILTMTSINIPTMRDISKYETAMLSSGSNNNSQSKEEVNRLSEAINRIAGKSPITTPGEQAKFSQVREKLVSESKKGNSVADSVLKAAGPVGSNPLPEENKVQQVSQEDYEEVRKTWEQNYSTIEPPTGDDGKPQQRKAWLDKEKNNITIVIQLLQSQDPVKQKQGMDKVSQILPFLLLGGFSRNEIVTYLKAKLEAAKQVLGKAVSTQEDEDTMVDVDRKQTEKPKSMQIADELPNEEAADPNQPATTVPSDPNQRQY